ncbi:MAG: PhnB protein [Chloroflexi bacterium]|nr:PhnB protein [Chloroflexota bacterium]
MQYLLLIYGDESAYAQNPELGQKEMAEYGDYTVALKKSGQFKAGDALQPTATATTVRVRNGERLVTDGPFAETKEQLGGYYVVDCENLDQALDWAAKIPGAKSGSIEVRPLMELPAEYTAMVAQAARA